jgi:hypothetical protein
MRSYDPGFDTRNLLTARIELPEDLDESRAGQQLVHRLMDGLRGLPGVTAAGVISVAESDVTIETNDGGVRVAPTNRMSRVVRAGAGYFDALGISVTRGRTLADAGRDPGASIALVNEQAAREWWGGDSSDVVGSRIKLGSPSSRAPWVTVVGVVKTTGSLTVQAINWDASARVFVPMTEPGPSLILYARSSGNPLALLPSLHRLVVAADSRVRVRSAADAHAGFEEEIAFYRVTTDIVVTFAAFGLLLVLLGLYGVTAHAVARRTREIGIRKAMGAGPVDVIRTVGRDGAVVAGVGIVLGIGLSALVSRGLTSMLYGVSPLDVSVFAAAAVVTLVVVVVAMLLPARSALRVEAATTLRAE